MRPIHSTLWMGQVPSRLEADRGPDTGRPRYWGDILEARWLHLDKNARPRYSFDFGIIDIIGLKNARHGLFNGCFCTNWLFLSAFLGNLLQLWPPKKCPSMQVDIAGQNILKTRILYSYRAAFLCNIQNCFSL